MSAVGPATPPSRSTAPQGADASGTRRSSRPPAPGWSRFEPPGLGASPAQRLPLPPEHIAKKLVHARNVEQAVHTEIERSIEQLAALDARTARAARAARATTASPGPR